MCALLAATLAILMTASAGRAADVKGAKDYPGIGRFAGSAITGYQAKNFDVAP